MEGGPPMFRQDGSCPALLEDLASRFPVRGCHPLWPAFPDASGTKNQATGLVRVRSPLLAESRLMSFPPATEMFQFAGFASCTYGFSCRIPLAGWVAPFGDPGINDRSHLPRAFRSVPRPSSPLSAKASTRCPSFALERHTQRQEPLIRDCEARHRSIGPPGSEQAGNLTVVRRQLFSRRHSRQSARSHIGSSPWAQPRGRTRVSRLGHTTRFFTIVHQQRHPGRSTTLPGQSSSAA